MRSLLFLLCCIGCASFEGKSDHVFLDGPVRNPEPEPDLDDAVKRVLAGDDVIISRAGDWLVAQRCLWVLRERHACEVAFVERGRVVGTVPLQGNPAHAAVAQAIERYLPDRVSLSRNDVYGGRDPRGSSVYPVVIDKVLVLRDTSTPTFARGSTPWPFGSATTRPFTFHSPRARDHIVVPIELAPDRATAFALFRIDARERYTFVMFVPPIDRAPDLPRFPTEADVRALHAAVLRELAAAGASDATAGIAMKLRWLRLEDWLATPTQRLDISESLRRRRAEIRTATSSVHTSRP